METIESRRLHGYELFVELTKDGAKWNGDVFSGKWSEILYFENDETKEKALQTLSHYESGVDYRLINDNYAVWLG